MKNAVAKAISRCRGRRQKEFLKPAAAALWSETRMLEKTRWHSHPDRSMSHARRANVNLMRIPNAVHSTLGLQDMMRANAVRQSVQASAAVDRTASCFKEKEENILFFFLQKIYL